MIAFIVAFCCVCFENTTAVTSGIVGSACIVTGSLVGLCIWVGWDKHIHMQPEEPQATITFNDDENEKYDENAEKIGDTNVTVVPAQQCQRGGSPNSGPQGSRGSSISGSSGAAEHRRMYQLNTEWGGLWSGGRLNLASRSRRTGAPTTPDESDTTTIV